MASSPFTSTLKPLSPTPNSRFCPKFFYRLPSSPLLSFSHTLEPFRWKTAATPSATTVRVQTLDFSGSFFEGGFGSEDDPTSPPGSGMTAVEQREEPQCPPGLRQYETMAVLRPDMSEDERLALTQKYEEVKSLKICGNFVCHPFIC